MDNDARWDKLSKDFRSGAILEASRQDLESGLLALASLQVRSDENRQRALQMGETLRLLLARKDSQDVEKRAMIVSVIALIISILALMAGTVQALSVLGFIPTLVSHPTSQVLPPAASPLPAQKLPAQTSK